MNMGLMQNLQNRGTVPISLPSPIPSVNFSSARLSPNKVSYLQLWKLGQFNSLKPFFTVSKEASAISSSFTWYNSIIILKIYSRFSKDGKIIIRKYLNLNNINELICLNRKYNLKKVWFFYREDKIGNKKTWRVL